MYNHNKAQQSKNRVHISWDILYLRIKYDKIDAVLQVNTQKNISEYRLTQIVYSTYLENFIHNNWR